MSNYIIPESLDKEIDELEKLINGYQAGTVEPVKIKAYRVPFGVYEQRESETYMVRIRCGAGMITPAQLEKIADLSARFGDAKIHVTTRAEVQIHDVNLEDVVGIIKELKSAGLSTRGGGGNTVRNIVSQVDAGIGKNEVFDVAPYVIALTSRLCAESDSWNLPRKYKIAFAGSENDEPNATISDLGFIARIQDGQKGFKVYIAGGMGAKSAPGHMLYDFVGEEEVYPIARALKDMFNLYGNRKNKFAARLRFLWKQLGEEDFRAKFEAEYTKVKSAGYPPLSVEEILNEGSDPGVKQAASGEEFELWKKRYVREQKQANLFSILVPVELGNISSAESKSLARFLSPFSGKNKNGVIRLTRDQNILLTNIRDEYLGDLFYFLKEHKTDFSRPLVFDTTIGCAGASTCKLGIGNSPALVRAINKKLALSKHDLDKTGDITIKISGCPNSCAQHPTADLGFFGKAVRKDGFLYPAYNVVAGAVVADGKTELAKIVGSISARDIPLFLDDFLGVYAEKRGAYDSFLQYFQDGGKKDIIKCLEKYKDIPHFNDDKNYYFDWEARDLFSLAKRGVGECSAGLFDLIELDERNCEQTKKKIETEKDPEKQQELLYKLTLYAARMLLITRGVETETDEQVFEAFTKHFIKTGLVDASYKKLITTGKLPDKKKPAGEKKLIFEFVDAIKTLYQSMDNSLQFKTETGAAGTTKEPVQKTDGTEETSSEARFKDLRGVACPMNFVKTKMELSKIGSKEKLVILLDDGQPIQNVPGSVRSEGHKVLKEEKVENYWKVTIEKV